MITYRYSFIEDVKNTIRRVKHYRENRDFYRIWGKPKTKSAVVYFPPNIYRWIWTVAWSIFGKKPQIQSGFIDKIKRNYTCYWVSSGSWGDCDVNKKIIYCMPYKIEKSYPKTIEALIEHEITHGEFPESEAMEYQDREKFIQEKQNH